MKLIFKNLVSLGFVQGLNLLIPLLVTPYLIKNIGVSYFGVVSTAQSVVAFFVLLVDFGYNITAVRRIAQAKGNKEEIESIINGVFFLKLFLLTVSLILFVSLIFLVPQFYKNAFTYICSFTMVIGYSMLPMWYYQGIEKINKTIIPVMLFKLLSIAFIFYFIKSETDAPYVNLLFGLANIFTGVILYFDISRQYKISRKSINTTILKSELKGSVAMFCSNISVVLYANSSLLTLSFFLTPHTLGIYSIVDKIIQMLKAFLGIIHQVTYPRICNIVKDQDVNLFHFIKKIYVPVWVCVLAICLFLFFQPNQLVSYFVKDDTSFHFTTRVLKYFSFILFIISLNMPFYQALLAFKKDWLTVKILFAASVISILLNIILLPVFKIEGTVITMYLVETLVTVVLFYCMLQINKSYEKR